MAYEYTIKLYPYGADRGTVQIDPKAQYGYWEHRDCTEGGGLWFGPADHTGALELLDYDGAFELPRRVVEGLRIAGFKLDATFNPD